MIAEVRAFLESKNEVVDSLLTDSACLFNVTHKLNI